MAVENEIVKEGDDDFYAHLFHASKVSQIFMQRMATLASHQLIRSVPYFFIIIITYNLSKLLTILLGSEKHNVSFSNSLLLLILKVKKELHAIMLHLIFCSFHFFISLAFCWQIMSQHDSFVLSPGFSGAQSIRVKKVTMHSAQLPRWHFKTRPWPLALLFHLLLGTLSILYGHKTNPWVY